MTYILVLFQATFKKIYGGRTKYVIVGLTAGDCMAYEIRHRLLKGLNHSGNVYSKDVYCVYMEFLF